MLIARLLKNAITDGSLTIIDAKGRPHHFGETPPTGSNAVSDVVLRLNEPSLQTSLFFKPSLLFPEAYVDGRITIEKGSLYETLDLFTRNFGLRAIAPFGATTKWLMKCLRSLHQFNPLGRSRANVAHHYDLSRTLYDLFLDRDRQYSCAYFADPAMTLDEAQEAKKRHIAAKLLLKPGQKVLDIGCGWGGMALYLARVAGVDVTGLTLSTEQHAVAAERADAAKLEDRVRFHLRDYREETGRYDRIVSVGMFEHVGVPHYPAFFNKVRDLLADDGVALLHSIGRMNGPGTTNPWIRKYIFPGGYAPALSEVLPVIERAGLWVTDIEILRLHYAETLRAWRQRFEANRARIAELYDERFCRMWEVYLAGSEVSFRNQGHMVFQIQLAKRQTAVPLTREYIQDWERRHAATAGIAA